MAENIIAVGAQQRQQIAGRAGQGPVARIKDTQMELDRRLEAEADDAAAGEVGRRERIDQRDAEILGDQLGERGAILRLGGRECA